MTAAEVTAWLEAQPPEVRRGVELLRAAVLAVEAPWSEMIKWNAPSFALQGEDRVTLGVERNGGWRLVLHRGAATKVDGFAFEDASGLARWPSPDRGVIRFGTPTEVESNSAALTDLVRRWIAATA